MSAEDPTEPVVVWGALDRLVEELGQVTTLTGDLHRLLAGALNPGGEVGEDDDG